MGHYTLTLETRQSVGYNQRMRFLKIMLVWVFLSLLAAVLFLVLRPGSFQLTELSFSGNKVHLPKLDISWDFRELRSPKITLNTPKVVLPAGEALQVVVVLKPLFNTLSADSIGVKKAALKDLRATFKYKGGGLEFDRIRGRFAGQQVLGTAAVKAGKEPSYRLSLAVSDLPAQTVIDAMEWDKKVAVRGVFTGRLEIEGKGGKLSRFDGLFDADPSGGTIALLDQEMLRRVADSAKQPIEIVKASFENYHYNEGKIRLALDETNLKLDLALDGEAGKRKLEVNLHDLFSRT